MTSGLALMYSDDFVQGYHRRYLPGLELFFTLRDHFECAFLIVPNTAQPLVPEGSEEGKDQYRPGG